MSTINLPNGATVTGNITLDDIEASYGILTVEGEGFCEVHYTHNGQTDGGALPRAVPLWVSIGDGYRSIEAGTLPAKAHEAPTAAHVATCLEVSMRKPGRYGEARNRQHVAT